MAQFFRAKASSSKGKTIELAVESMDHQGRGVAKHQGKVCFVDGALAGERVKAQIQQDKSKLIIAKTIKLQQSSEHRVNPFCEHYNECGGCQLQHLAHTEQLNAKQQALSKLFAKFAKAEQLPWQASIESEPTHYRRAARIACFYDKQSQQLKVGFRSAKSKHIVDIKKCDVLSTPFANSLEKLRVALNSNKVYSSVSHVQLCDADNGQYLLLRHTKPINESHKEKFASLFSEDNWHLLWDDAKQPIHYEVLPNYLVADLAFEFKLSNFIQVNRAVNEKMLLQAQTWLLLKEDDQVLDLFCGIGNFSLLMAKQANRVIGVEGSESSVAMAKQNAHTNKISNVQFFCSDLTTPLAGAQWFCDTLNVLLLDPSRTGAYEILQQMPLQQFEKVLYVSCDPVTLARDSALLLQAGFEIRKIGLMNMFPHTGHIETMALFQRR
ncbi:23S rRNA (uracil(1939)-C(5))-methyltransferase RlmD [Pseudoalteromonas byunsanensis]|uniref:23S rRNA (uracil(1939)-C(5))-methyltransferase RlmD n=1 Tax=Pseudoalteromonas byunsanensis TaxID=327939 RepID=A0A1S1N3Q2_9GAMM|nr:23S rRNA (uracil(1939)-C(5))-methyltransferase RlmD [Pseudoalteromonas byunsanensis]OHU95735.1 23S rRNA (uracil(1939)-C(5))-methyltransferase [Pseudoalteromonas byunsanensis]